MRVRRDMRRLLHAFIQRGHFRDTLQRILRADQPPDLVEAELFERINTHRPVPVMGGVDKSRPSKPIFMPEKAAPLRRCGF